MLSTKYWQQTVWILLIIIINAWHQNNLRQFALKGLSNILQTSKRENKALQLWLEGEGCGLFCSEVPLFEYNVPSILSLIDIYDYTGLKK